MSASTTATITHLSRAGTSHRWRKRAAARPKCALMECVVPRFAGRPASVPPPYHLRTNQPPRPRPSAPRSAKAWRHAVLVRRHTRPRGEEEPLDRLWWPGLVRAGHVSSRFGAVCWAERGRGQHLQRRARQDGVGACSRCRSGSGDWRGGTRRPTDSRPPRASAAGPLARAPLPAPAARQQRQLGEGRERVSHGQSS